MAEDVSNADLVLSGGRMLIDALAGPVTGGIAVRAGRIVAVGPMDRIEAAVGPETEVVDCAGRLVTAGFTDAHVHPVSGGRLIDSCQVPVDGTVEECVAAVVAYAATLPPGSWVTGGGWGIGTFPAGRPSRQMLDDAVADHPVSLVNRDGHGSWVNTAALRLAGVDASTPDPADGRIEREPDGHPSGLLHEGAVTLVSRHMPEPSETDLYQGLLRGQEYLLSQGITSWQDAIVGDSYNMTDVLPAYLRADHEGTLLGTAVGALWWDRDRGLEQVGELIERRDQASRCSRFSANTVKIMQDGVAENFTAAMSEPYLDACGCATANSGLSFVDPTTLAEAVVELDRQGFQVHFHALGDRAVTEALDALEAARRANGQNDHRHHLAHLQVVRPADRTRFAALNVTATIQPLWAVHERQMNELTIPFLGSKLAGWQYPFAGLLEEGARLAGGSDWPVSTANVWHGVHTAVERRNPGSDAAPRFLPDQVLGLGEAIAAYTTGGAYVNHRDGRAGALAVGMDADLAVHDRDPFDPAVGPISKTTVQSTYVAGALVHGGTT